MDVTGVQPLLTTSTRLTNVATPVVLNVAVVMQLGDVTVVLCPRTTSIQLILPATLAKPSARSVVATEIALHVQVPLITSTPVSESASLAAKGVLLAQLREGAILAMQRLLTNTLPATSASSATILATNAIKTTDVPTVSTTPNTSTPLY